MLQRMRQGAQGFGAKVLVVLIIVVLAFFGFGAFNIFVSPDPAVATVNGEDIGTRVVEMSVERQRQQFLAQMGPGADPDLIDNTMLRQGVIENLINRTLMIQAAEDMGLAVSEAQIDALLLQNPQFQTGGQFDPVRFRAVVASMGYTPVTFRQEYARDVMLTTLDQGLTETAYATERGARLLAALIHQQRDVAYLEIGAGQFREEAAELVTAEDIEAYYDAYRYEFTTEERVDVEYVQLNIAELVDSDAIVVDDEEVRTLYEQEREQFDAAESRRAAHILLELDERTEEEARAELEAIRERVEAGESFGDLAREYSEDAGSARAGGDLGFVSRGAMVPAFEAELWQLDEGELSEPVVTQFGLHLIKLSEIRRDEFPPFEEMEADLRERLRLLQAERLFAERAEELESWAFEYAESLEPLAEEFGLEIQQAEGITRSSGPGLFADRNLREQAFSSDVQEGWNSPTVAVGDSAVVLRQREHYPARELPLDEVRDEIQARLVDEEARELARVAVAQAQERLRAGDSAAVVAGDLNLRWRTLEGARRDATDVPRPVINEAFELPRPDVDGRSIGNVSLPGGDFALVTVTRVVDGDWEALRTSERETLQRQLGDQVGNQDFEAFFQTVRDEARIRRRG